MNNMVIIDIYERSHHGAKDLKRTEQDCAARKAACEGEGTPQCLRHTQDEY